MQEIAIQSRKGGTKAIVTNLGELTVVTTGGATEVTTDAIKTATEATQAATEAIETASTDLARTPNMLRSSTSSSVAVAVHSVSVHNAGIATGTVLGANILAGETVNFDAGGNGNMLTAGSLTFDGTGTDFLIIYIT